MWLRTWPLFDFDRDTRAVTYAASAIARREGWSTMTPELLLYALLHDEAVRAFWGEDAAIATTAALRAAIEKKPTPDHVDVGTDGWTTFGRATAFGALHRASRRSYLRPADVPPVHPAATAGDDAPPRWPRRALERLAVRAGGAVVRPGTWIARGDLLHALGAFPGGAHDHMKGLPRLFGALDREDPPVPTGDAMGSRAPEGVHRGSVVLDDEPSTTMSAVVSLLAEEVGLAADRALVAMHRVHFRGTDRVVTLPWDQATDVVARCRSRLLRDAPRLVVRLVPG